MDIIDVLVLNDELGDDGPVELVNLSYGSHQVAKLLSKTEDLTITQPVKTLTNSLIFPGSHACLTRKPINVKPIIGNLTGRRKSHIDDDHAEMMCGSADDLAT